MDYPGLGRSSTEHRPHGPAPHESRVHGLNVDVVHRSDRWRASGLDQALIERAARQAHRAAAGPASRAPEVAVVLTSDEEVQALNAKWRRQDRPTNVLSFSLAAASPIGQTDGDPQSEFALGDVVLAFETVATEARAAGLDLSEHAAHLVVHGILHLHGYDHERDEDARRMEDLERLILSQLGVGDPYEPGNGAPIPVVK